MSCPLIFVLDHFYVYFGFIDDIYINTKILANNNNCHNQSKINVKTVGVMCIVLLDWLGYV